MCQENLFSFLKKKKKRQPKADHSNQPWKWWKYAELHVTALWLWSTRPHRAWGQQTIRNYGCWSSTLLLFAHPSCLDVSWPWEHRRTWMSWSQWTSVDSPHLQGLLPAIIHTYHSWGLVFNTTQTCFLTLIIKKLFRSSSGRDLNFLFWDKFHLHPPLCDTAAQFSRACGTWCVLAFAVCCLSTMVI